MIKEGASTSIAARIRLIVIDLISCEVTSNSIAGTLNSCRYQYYHFYTEIFHNHILQLFVLGQSDNNPKMSSSVVSAFNEKDKNNENYKKYLAFSVFLIAYRTISWKKHFLVCIFTTFIDLAFWCIIWSIASVNC